MDVVQEARQSKNYIIRDLQANDLWGFIVSVQVLLLTFLNLETLLAVVSALASLALYDVYDMRYGGVSWTFVSFALIFPISTSMSTTFHRREEALQQLASVKALTTQLVVGLLRWDWDKREGRKKVPENFETTCRSLINAMLDNMDHYFTAMNVSRAKHLYTEGGLTERKRVREEQMNHYGDFLQNLEGVGELIEVLKQIGFPANEASRLNQYVSLLQESWEKMRVVKDYRTMQVARSYTRVFILLLPAIYGPYYANLITAMGQRVFPYCLAVVTQLVVVGFMCAQSAMEDPFNNHGFDTVRWKDEIFEFREAIRRVFDSDPDEIIAGHD